MILNKSSYFAAYFYELVSFLEHAPWLGTIAKGSGFLSGAKA